MEKSTEQLDMYEGARHGLLEEQPATSLGRWLSEECDGYTGMGPELRSQNPCKASYGGSLACNPTSGGVGWRQVKPWGSLASQSS